MDRSMNTSDEEVDIEDETPMDNGGKDNVSKAQQRKSNKPIMEKRRRARINQCLNELKSLILEALKKDPARHSKLEKADILEMTVKHLQNIQRQQLTTAVAADPSVITKFKTGFAECAAEVSRIMSRMDGVDNSVRQRLLNHLSSCIGGLQQLPVPPLIPGFPSYPAATSLNDLNNNAARLLQNLNLIPSRLPTGEVAFVLPNAVQFNMNVPSTSGCVPSMPIRERTERLASAFVSPPRKLDTSSGSESDSPKQFTVEIPGSAFSQRVTGSVRFSLNSQETTKIKREREDNDERPSKQAKLSIHFSHVENDSAFKSMKEQSAAGEGDNMWRPW